MRIIKILLPCLLLSLTFAGPALADPGDISIVIEDFIAKRFPEAQSHFWVVNSTARGSEDEVVVDVNTLVLAQGDQAPTENRFLLLIVAGKLEGMQSVPLGAYVVCQPDQTV